jgi:hypothetical protein
MKITHASSLTDSDLVAALARLAHGEREATVALIVHLAEFDGRRLFEGAGFSSTFKYCLEVLRLSEDAAFNRIEAARAARRYPAALDMLVTGALSPTTARMLARHLTPENHHELLAAASGKSKQQVEKLLAGLFPQPDVPSGIRKLPAARPSVPLTATTPALDMGAPPDARGEADTASTTLAGPGAGVVPLPAAPAPATAPLVRPLASERYLIRFTASAETCEKLRQAQDLLGHVVPSGDLAEVFDRALTVLVEDLQRKKFAAHRQPRRSRGQKEESRNIPAQVRRAVWARDGGRCAFLASSGRRCDERRRLEFHHVQPYGAGGRPTVANLRLACAIHNRHEAELFYGPGRRYGAGEVSELRAVYRTNPPVPERATREAQD